MIAVLRTKADSFLGATSVVLFVLSIFTSLIKVDINVAIALVSYFFINKNVHSKYSLHLVQLRQVAVISCVTLIFDIIWIGIWSKAYNKHHNDGTPSTTIKFAFVMAFMSIVVKIFYCVLLSSYWNDASFSKVQFAADEKKTDMFQDDVELDTDLQTSSAAASPEKSKPQPTAQRAQNETATAAQRAYDMSPVTDSRLNQNAEPKYLRYSGGDEDASVTEADEVVELGVKADEDDRDEEARA